MVVGAIAIFLFAHDTIRALLCLKVQWVILLLLPPMALIAILHLRAPALFVSSHIVRFVPIYAVDWFIAEGVWIPPEILSVVRVDTATTIVTFQIE
jgi:hypothetical protein